MLPFHAHSGVARPRAEGLAGSCASVECFSGAKASHQHLRWPLAGTGRHHCSAPQHLLGLCEWPRLRARYAVRARSSIAPNMPLPGDDQAALVFSALQEVEEAAEAAAAALLSGGAASGTQSSANGTGSSLAQGAPPSGPESSGGSGGGGNPGPEVEKPQRIPHRWRVVGMMALAFVLCNMDKVPPYTCP